MKMAIVFGTRPEIIKLESLIHEVQKNAHDIHPVVINTNQHYSHNMLQTFLEEFRLVSSVNYTLDHQKSDLSSIGFLSSTLKALETIYKKEQPDFVIVQGDTDSTVAATIAATKLSIPVGHVEAGLRSFDKTMPEEINRIITDHSSELLFAPTPIAVENLQREGLPNSSIFLTGNTIVDAVNDVLGVIDEVKTLKQYEVEQQNYGIVTIHRKKNVDTVENLRIIFNMLHKLPKLPLIFPLHPRTKQRLHEFELWTTVKRNSNIIITEPLGYIDFISLLKNAKFIITDSGGIQEESAIFNVPCFTVRDNTERNETIDIGINQLIGYERDNLIKSIAGMLNKREKDIRQTMQYHHYDYSTERIATHILNIIKSFKDKIIN